MQRLIFQISTLLAMTSLLVACGGGSGGTVNSNMPTVVGSGPSVEGVYSGTLTGSIRPKFIVAILDDGSYWGFYGQQSSAGFQIYSLVQGYGASNTIDGTFTSSRGVDFGYTPPYQVSISSTYTTSPQKIDGTVNYSSQQIVHFSGGALSGTTYQYGKAATLPDVTGPWKILTTNGDDLALTISPTGAYSGTTQVGCTFKGTISPRSSGKNIFDISVTFGGPPCDLANKTATGIALSLPQTDGTKQLVFAVVDMEHANGFAGYSY